MKLCKGAQAQRRPGDPGDLGESGPKWAKGPEVNFDVARVCWLIYMLI